MTRRNPNISRTFLLLTVQEEINISLIKTEQKLILKHIKRC